MIPTYDNLIGLQQAYDDAACDDSGEPGKHAVLRVWLERCGKSTRGMSTRDACVEAERLLTKYADVVPQAEERQW
jgi:hypothetical protein